jgi:hypothetical protein
MGLSLDARTGEVEAALGGPGRFVDLGLRLRRARGGETLLDAGGRWDRLDRRFVERDLERMEYAVVEMEESQVEFTRWFAGFLRDYREGRPRDVRLALAAGDRRGGKTFDLFIVVVAAMLDVPLTAAGTPTVGWAISRTFRQRDELDQLMAAYVPEGYYHHRRAPEHRFEFPHGSYLRNLSADDPESSKQGRVDFLFYNEPQLMSPRAVKNGLYGTADTGGVCVMAANPPSRPQDEWLLDLKEAIEEDPYFKPITRFFNFSSRDNTKIDQPARAAVARIAEKIDPDMADVDAEGVWRRWGDLAYPAWNGRDADKGGMVGDPPDGAQDVTYQVTRRELGEPHAHVIGGDFQRRPQAAAVARVLLVPGVADPIYWFVDEVGVKGTEVELSTELMGAPHSYVPAANDPRGAVWVGDCSGSWQGAERIRGRTSFSLLEAEGWRIHPAEVVRVPGRSDHPKNPEVAQRLGLMMRLMSAGRVRVSPACEWLRESFAKCVLRKAEVGRRVPTGRYSHVTDAASYAVWRLEPRPIIQRPVRAGDVRIVKIERRGGFL